MSDLDDEEIEATRKIYEKIYKNKENKNGNKYKEIQNRQHRADNK